MNLSFEPFSFPDDLDQIFLSQPRGSGRDMYETRICRQSKGFPPSLYSVFTFTKVMLSWATLWEILP